MLNSYIRESARVAWHMSCLVYPIDLAFATDSEVFDETKYKLQIHSMNKKKINFDLDIDEVMIRNIQLH